MERGVAKGRGEINGGGGHTSRGFSPKQKPAYVISILGGEATFTVRLYFKAIAVTKLQKEYLQISTRAAVAPYTNGDV